MQQSLYKYLIVFFFFIQYLGIGAIAQVLIILLIIYELSQQKKIYFSQIETLFIMIILLLFGIKLFGVGIDSNILLFKFYWGFLLFFIFFRIAHFIPNYRFLFKCTLAISIIDAIMINTIVPLNLMKNIPAGHIAIIVQEAGDYYILRSYGLASSPTASATLLVVLLSCVYTYQREFYKDIYILMTAGVLLLFGSGTGFLLFLLFLIARYKLYRGFNVIIGFVLLLFFIIFVKNNNFEDGGLLMRMSGVYFDALINLKEEQINEVLAKLNTIFQLFFGYNYESAEELRVMSDFGWLDFFECYGVFGIFFFFLFSFSKLKSNMLPIAIILIGYFHYPSLGSIPGQILFGSIIAQNYIRIKCVNKQFKLADESV